ncbi:MAG: FAD-dependent oxidoreductase [Phaeodactylibacter sp.]|nr:FAD-dependent oxidoreductase [Phaeodactylibacter sp.]MCB9052293.1 FAD-dependent oxidoreductase [Lewinellaceae bacterium]
MNQAYRRSLLLLFPILVLIFFSSCQPRPGRQFGVVIIGGGASGVMAGIQAARQGVPVAIVEETPWLGGMLTSAGVSAIDGNHRLPSGLWGEFRQRLYDHYGGPEAVATGWVSNCLFEPSVGDSILKSMAGLPNLEIFYETRWRLPERIGGKWKVRIENSKGIEELEAKVLIDATELGDVMAALHVPYSLGMDDGPAEPHGPANPNDIIQDLTYVLTLKDYGEGADKTIGRPEGYDPEEFRCACIPGLKAGQEGMSCEQMLQYGRLPNDKYMINWPNCGNDYYLNIIEKTPKEREEALKQAKLQSLRFLYFIQTEAGYPNLGLAQGEYPTPDGLPMIPYYRESRRLKGAVRLTSPYLSAPFQQKYPLYRTGVAVGDYPIDHHHKKNPGAPAIDFINIKVPSYNVPLGALIPLDTEGLIVAEKSISVSNIVNGATRLQPVVMGIGQAAGALAALAAQTGKTPAEVPVRDVQQVLLEAGAYLMPYLDVPVGHPQFAAIQHIGATGLLRGVGVPYQWANQTWFFPDSLARPAELAQGLKGLFDEMGAWNDEEEYLSPNLLGSMMEAAGQPESAEAIGSAWEILFPGRPYQPDAPLTRAQTAALLDKAWNPFSLPITLTGQRKTD